MRWIYDLLCRVLAKKQHNVTGLKWEKAELERQIALQKRNNDALSA